ncbi:unnamed protein product, partial [Oppiella nova]
MLYCFINCLIILKCIAFVSAISGEPNLIVISFDAFRYDFLSKELTPNLYNLAANGVTGHMISNFITKTYPNHQSIATGFFEENHGIINNEFFDPKYNQEFKVGKHVPDYWWTEAPVTPVWTANQLSGRASGVMQWPGGGVKYKNQTVRHYQRYDPDIQWHIRMDTIVQWMTDKKDPANCVFAYFNEPDS